MFKKIMCVFLTATMFFCVLSACTDNVDTPISESSEEISEEISESTPTSSEGEESAAESSIVDISSAVSEEVSSKEEIDDMQATKKVVPADEDVVVFGRYYKKNQLLHAGAVYEFKFTGSTIGAHISGGGNGFFEVSIDGGDYTRYDLDGTAKEFIFSEELDASSEHIIRIMRGKDIWLSAFAVNSIILAKNGEIVKGYTGDYDLKIEFVGDSITSGGVVDQYSKSYVALCANELNAEFNVVSRSGQGLYMHSGLVADRELIKLYRGIQFDSNDYEYTFDADIVVLNIGSNDSANIRRLTEAKDDAGKEDYRIKFKELYKQMLDEIHKANPNAAILCVCGQMEFHDYVKEGILSSIELFSNENPDVNIDHYFLPKGMDISKETNWHPGEKSHARDGKLVAQKIRQMLDIEQ